MKQETKDMILKMVKVWNQFNQQKAVNATTDDSEFDKGCWSLDVALTGVVNSEFMAFLLPALIVHNCHWFMYAHNDNLIMHIQ